MAFTATKLAEALDLTPETAALLVQLVRHEVSPFTVPTVDRWRQQCYHEPREFHPETIMKAIDALIGTYGTEPIWGRSCTEPVAEYCNTGDTYAPTILYDYMNHKYRLTSWGDWVETYGDRYGVQ